MWFLITLLAFWVCWSFKIPMQVIQLSLIIPHEVVGDIQLHSSNPRRQLFTAFQLTCKNNFPSFFSVTKSNKFTHSFHFYLTLFACLFTSFASAFISFPTSTLPVRSRKSINEKFFFINSKTSLIPSSGRMNMQLWVTYRG